MNKMTLVGIVAVLSVAFSLQVNRTFGAQASGEGDSSFQVDIQFGGSGTTLRTDNLNDFSYLNGGK